MSVFAKYLLLAVILSSGFYVHKAQANEIRCGTRLVPNALSTPTSPTPKNRYGEYECLKAPITDVKDQASLRRGAAIFMNQCASCHSLKFMRYDSIATDLSIPTEQMKQFLQLGNAQINDEISARLVPDLQLKMFGTVPPDLTLTTRKHSPDWVYTYLLSFYPDPTRPLGVNNTVLPDTAMPNVLAALHQQVGDQAFKAQVGDLVNFLNYSAEPKQHHRKIYGIVVLLFLLIFLIPVYLLHKEYWKDIQ